jgi:hypothetical protein
MSDTQSNTNETPASQGKTPKKPPLEIYPILDCKISHAARYLYQYLQSNTANYMPTQRTIMKHTGLSGASIVSAKKHLVKHNMIRIKKVASSKGSEKDLIYVHTSAKWTDIIWLNPRSGPVKKAVQKVHRLSGSKSASVSGSKSASIEKLKEKKKETSRGSSTNSRTSSGQNKNKKTTGRGLIDKLRACNDITVSMPTKEKNFALKPILKQYDFLVVQAFVEDAKSHEMIFGSAERPWENLIQCLDHFKDHRYKKNDPAEQ